jgi:putative DNA-invertase from lambdoid prophage Rac
MALAQARKIDAILVTELSRWGRSTQDLADAHHHGWSSRIRARSHPRTREVWPNGPKARGIALGRQFGQRPSDKKARKVLQLHGEGLSYRLIGRNVGLSKNTVMGIIRRDAPAT